MHRPDQSHAHARTWRVPFARSRRRRDGRPWRMSGPASSQSRCAVVRVDTGRASRYGQITQAITNMTASAKPTRATLAMVG